MLQTIYRWSGTFQILAHVLTRIGVGLIFLQAGWGKLNNLERTIGFFTNIGIPLPQVQGPMVALFEFLGGLFLILGFGTRLTAIPLFVIMMVALKTAHWAEVKSFVDIFGQDTALYGILLLWLVGYGAGPFSVDRLTFEKRLKH